MITQLLSMLEHNESIRELGSLYDEVRIIQITAVTPKSELVLYRCQRRQDHADGRPWDYKAAIIVDGFISQTIAIPY